MGRRPSVWILRRRGGLEEDKAVRLGLARVSRGSRRALLPHAQSRAMARLRG